MSLRVLVFLELLNHVQHLWSRRRRRRRHRWRHHIFRRVVGGLIFRGFIAIGSRGRASADEVV